MQKKVRQITKGQCYPPLSYSAEIIEAEGESVVAVIIGVSANRPHFSGPAFVRIGSETVVASPELYEELIASRNSKADAILHNKGAVITVVARKLLGNPKRIRDKSYYAKHECRIEGCDAHVVHLYDFATKTLLSEPLDKITILYDSEKQRMMLDIDE